MKSAKLLGLYKTGRRNFSYEDLRGQSFRGRELIGIDLSGADIRGASFINADLEDANFTLSIAGARFHWTALQLILGFFLSVPLVIVLSAHAEIILAIISPSKEHPRTSGWVFLVATATLVSFASMGITPSDIGDILNQKMVSLEMLLGNIVDTVLELFFKPTRIKILVWTCFTMFFIFLISEEAFRAKVVFSISSGLLLDIKNTVGVAIDSERASIILSIAADAIVAISAFAILFLFEYVFAGLFSVYLKCRGLLFIASSCTLPTLLVFLLDLIPAIGLSAVILSNAMLWLLVCYLQTLTGDSYFPRIRYFSSLGCTTFLGANLTRANFFQAKLFGSDFRRTQLSYVRWEKAKQLESARLFATYLEVPHVKQIFMTRKATPQSFYRTGAFGCLTQLDLTEVDLCNVNLEKVDLRETNLTRTSLRASKLRNAVLSGAKLQETDLRDVDLRNAVLSGAKLQETNLRNADLRNADLSRLDLRNADLRGVCLRGTDLREIDLSGVDLSGANLYEANLSRCQALGTIFNGADLTGICLEDWNINSTTEFDSVLCQYIYLKNGRKERRPREGIFNAGEFAALFQKAVDTVDLIFTDGIDWQAFFQSFQELKERYKSNEIEIQSIERKDSAFVIRLETTADPDGCSSLEISARELYQEKVNFLKAQVTNYAKLIEAEKIEKSTLIGIVKTMAESQKVPTNQTNIYASDSNIGAVQSGSGVIHNVSQNIIANLDEIISLVQVLKGQAQAFPENSKADVEIVIEDLESDLADEKKRKPTRLAKRIQTLWAITCSVAVGVAGVADFSNNLLELSEKLSVPLSIELIQKNPHILPSA